MEIGAQYKQESTTRPSPAVWADCNYLEAIARGDIVLWDDFLNHLGTNDLGTARFAFKDTNGSITFQTDQVGGVMRFGSDATDNCGPVLTYGDDVAGLVKFSAGKKLWLEARLEPQQIVTQNFFFGLAEEGLAVDNGFWNDSDEMADKDYVGFSIATAASATVTTTYNTAGGSTSPVTLDSGAHTIVAGTAVKFGMVFDGKKLRFFVDGVENSTSVLMTATDFPDGEEMSPYVAIKNSTTAGCTWDIDWIRLVAER